MYDAILLIAFGSPSAPEEIRPFLARVTEGMSIPPERIEEVAHHYEAVGGKSPLNEITYRQAAALQTALSSLNIKVPVDVGFRNAAPFFIDTLKQICEAGGRRIAQRRKVRRVPARRQSRRPRGRHRRVVGGYRKNRQGAAPEGEQQLARRYAEGRRLRARVAGQRRRQLSDQHASRLVEMWPWLMANG